jgi:hypothetical protein
MVNPLTFATKGRLNNSFKRTLTLATLGWLIAVNEPPPTPEKPRGVDTYTTRKQQEEKNITFISIERDDDEVFNLIKIFLECRN